MPPGIQKDSNGQIVGASAVRVIFYAWWSDGFRQVGLDTCWPVLFFKRGVSGMALGIISHARSEGEVPLETPP